MQAFFQRLAGNYIECAAVLLFAIGFTVLLLDRNMIKKIIGLNIVDTSVYLFLASIGYIEDRLSPILRDGVTGVEAYVNPLPAGLVLTGIVVSVSVTALMLSLSVKLYTRSHTLNLDTIYMLARYDASCDADGRPHELTQVLSAAELRRLAQEDLNRTSPEKHSREADR